MPNVHSRRSSQSERRQEKTEIARRKIIETAYRLFRDDGYLVTTFEKIAEEAQVPVSTVTGLYGTKFMLLDVLVKIYTRGDDSPTIITSRTWWQAMLQEPNATEQIRAYVKTIRVIHERTVGIVEIIRRAAAADAEIAAMRKVLNDGRLEDVRPVAVSLAAKGALIADISIDRARDILWTLGSADTYRALVVDLHWSAEEYEIWLSHLLITSLLRKGFS